MHPLYSVYRQEDSLLFMIDVCNLMLLTSQYLLSLANLGPVGLAQPVNDPGLFICCPLATDSWRALGVAQLGCF